MYVPGDASYETWRKEILHIFLAKPKSQSHLREWARKLVHFPKLIIFTLAYMRSMEEFIAFLYYALGKWVLKDVKHSAYHHGIVDGD